MRGPLEDVAQPQPDPEDRSRPGRALVAIGSHQRCVRLQPPGGGAVADVAVYTDHAKPLALLRRILLRMKSWLNFISL